MAIHSTRHEPLKSGTIRGGIGGWVYEPWRKTFYPPDMPKARELAYASRHVGAIEINATFYRTQTPETFRRWAGETPDDFQFSVKASRYACSRRDLAGAGEAITRFLESGLTELGPKLGPILWQLAATKVFDPGEIGDFFALLPREADGVPLRHVLEPRHPSFQVERYVALARAAGVGTVLALSDDYPMIADPTADTCYLRLQTAAPELPNGYDDASIARWAERVRALAAGGTIDGLPLLAEPPAKRPRDCFVFFIAGAKERNPAAARALIEALAPA